jgi:prepilin-type N-terminal cleavage/methylation domain-containing protein
MILLTGKTSIDQTPEDAGFTFLELLIVITLLGILTALSIPRFKQSTENMQLSSTAQQLQSYINFLVQRSVVETVPIRMSLDTEKNSYRAQKEQDIRYFQDFRLPSGIRIATDKQDIFIYPDGTIDTVTITLTNKQNKSMTLTTQGVFGGTKIKTQ